MNGTALFWMHPPMSSDHDGAAIALFFDTKATLQMSGDVAEGMDAAIPGTMISLSPAGWG